MQLKPWWPYLLLIAHSTPKFCDDTPFSLITIYHIGASIGIKITDFLYVLGFSIRAGNIPPPIYPCGGGGAVGFKWIFGLAFAVILFFDYFIFEKRWMVKLEPVDYHFTWEQTYKTMSAKVCIAMDFTYSIHTFSIILHLIQNANIYFYTLPRTALLYWIKWINMFSLNWKYEMVLWCQIIRKMYIIFMQL